MWFVYHVMPALLAAASGICLYVSLRHMPCDTAAGRKVKLAATLLAVAGMLDFLQRMDLVHDASVCVPAAVAAVAKACSSPHDMGLSVVLSVGAGADHRRMGNARVITGPIMSW